MLGRRSQYKKIRSLLKDRGIYAFWQDDIVISYKVKDLAKCYIFFNAIYKENDSLNSEKILEAFKKSYGYVISTRHLRRFLRMARKNNIPIIRNICAGYSPYAGSNNTLSSYEDQKYRQNIESSLNMIEMYSMKKLD